MAAKLTFRLTPRDCGICGDTFQPRRSKVETCGKRACAAALGHRKHPRRRKRPMRQCPECLDDFQPKRRGQKHCTRRCSSIARERLTGNASRAMAKAWRARVAKDRARIAQKVAGLTPVDAFRYGVRLGRQGLWQRLVREGVIVPDDKRRWTTPARRGTRRVA